MASGTANENFVRINLKKKVFVRGKKTQTGSSYKRQQWKQRQQSASGGGGGGGGGVGGGAGRKGGASSAGSWKNSKCKRCGELGHWARNCSSTADKLMPAEQAAQMDDPECGFPTLDEAMDMAGGGAGKADGRGDNSDVQLMDLQAIAVAEPLLPPDSQVPDQVYEMLNR